MKYIKPEEGSTMAIIVKLNHRGEELIVSCECKSLNSVKSFVTRKMGNQWYTARFVYDGFVHIKEDGHWHTEGHALCDNIEEHDSAVEEKLVEAAMTIDELNSTDTEAADAEDADGDMGESEMFCENIGVIRERIMCEALELSDTHRRLNDKTMLRLKIEANKAVMNDFKHDPCIITVAFSSEMYERTLASLVQKYRDILGEEPARQTVQKKGIASSIAGAVLGVCMTLLGASAQACDTWDIPPADDGEILGVYWTDSIDFTMPDGRSVHVEGDIFPTYDSCIQTLDAKLDHYEAAVEQARRTVSNPIIEKVLGRCDRVIVENANYRKPQWRGGRK